MEFRVGEGAGAGAAILGTPTVACDNARVGALQKVGHTVHRARTPENAH